MFGNCEINGGLKGAVGFGELGFQGAFLVVGND